MKKVLCFVLVIFSLISLVGCNQQVEKQSVAGSWEAQAELSVLGIDIPDSDEKQTVDMLYSFDFNEDGTGKSSILVDEKYKTFVPDTNSDFTYTFDGEKLELKHEDGKTQVFTVSFSEGKLILDGRSHIELVPKK